MCLNPNKNLGPDSLMSFPDRRFPCCHNVFLEELSTSTVTALGEDFWLGRLILASSSLSPASSLLLAVLCTLLLRPIAAF